MPSAKAQAVIHKIFNALQKHQPVPGDLLIAGHPSMNVTVGDAELLVASIPPEIPARWKDALAALLAYEASRNAPAVERLPLLTAYVKALARAAAEEPVWAATALRRNCQILTQQTVAADTRALYDGAAAAVRQAFRITVSDFDGEEPMQGRTRECYAVAVCLLLLYVRMRAYSLAEGILQAIAQYSSSIPPLSQARWHIQLVYLFHQGLLLFTKQKYSEASACFDNAIAASKEVKLSEFQHIMAYHIPAKYLSHNQAPTDEVWELVPRLAAIYRHAITYSRQGDLVGLHREIQKHRAVLVQQRILLAFEAMVPRARLNLLRRTWLIAGQPRRLPLAAFTAALRAAEGIPDPSAADATAEFYVAQFIAEGKVKGYIHHDLQLVMLSGTRPFPTLLQSAPSPQV